MAQCKVTPSEGAPPMSVHDFCYMMRPHVLHNTGTSSDAFTVLVDEDKNVTCKFPVTKGRGDRRHKSSFSTTHQVDALSGCRARMVFREGGGGAGGDSRSQGDDETPSSPSSPHRSDSDSSDDSDDQNKSSHGQQRGGYQTLKELCRKNPRAAECKQARSEEDKFSRRRISGQDALKYEGTRNRDMERLKNDHFQALNTRPVKWNETFDHGRHTRAEF